MQRTRLLLSIIIHGAICLSATAAILPDEAPLKPRHPAAADHYEIRELFSMKGYYSEAISEYKKALEINPEHVDAIFDLGILYIRQKGYGLAAVQFRKLLVLRPGNKMAAGYAEYCERMED